MSAVSIDWDACAEDGCIGVRSEGRERCIAHLSPAELTTALALLHRNGSIDARGVTLDRSLLDRIRASLPRTREEWPQFGRADFSRATFEGYVDFRQVIFRDAVIFDGAVFAGAVGFDNTTFQGSALFQDVTFADYAFFKSALFCDLALFRRSSFMGYGNFQKATFQNDVIFGYGVEAHPPLKRTTFNDNATFNEAVFQGDAAFGAVEFAQFVSFRATTFAAEMNCWNTVFGSNAWFDDALFKGDAKFKEATFCRDASFRGASFEHARQVGPLLALATLSLESVRFDESVELAVSGDCLSLTKARFMAGVNASVRWAEVVMDDTYFGAASTFSGSPRPAGDSPYATFAFINEERLARLLASEIAQLKRTERPVILSMRRAIVGDLLLSDVDLRPCRFTRARYLGGLRLEGDVSFARSPGRRRGQRQVLAEECQWRTSNGPGFQRSRWRVAEKELPTWFREKNPGVEQALDAYLISATYRDLRNGREVNKDEPGAADFYYGEMEMRRLDKTKPRPERIILTLYWLVSGYGLRASRAVVSLAITVVLFGALFYLWGFPSQRSFVDAVTYSAQSTTSLFRAPDEPLTTTGKWLNMALRLLGPLFFGLALLSLRGRVRR